MRVEHVITMLHITANMLKKTLEKMASCGEVDSEAKYMGFEMMCKKYLEGK